MKTFKAIYDNARTVNNEDGTKTTRHYYRIVGMTEQEQAVYRADKGQYYVESKDGLPSYSVDANIGDELPIKRASKPNDKTGKFSWYHGQSEMQILETLVDAFPAIARVNIDSLVTKAKAQFTTERVTVDETSAVDKL
jgi:hypothetical protein